jgi:hypothetical protein
MGDQGWAAYQSLARTGAVRLVLTPGTSRKGLVLHPTPNPAPPKGRGNTPFPEGKTQEDGKFFSTLRKPYFKRKNIDDSPEGCYTLNPLNRKVRRQICGRSSFGRTFPCQGKGSRFEPDRPLSFERIQQFIFGSKLKLATWPSGKARLCKSLIMGSNPIVASLF